MAPLSFLSYLEFLKYSTPVNLFDINTSVSHPQHPISQQQTQTQAPTSKAKNCLRLLVDSESCLDRLYGGFYSDWASGGQWNRMFNYIGNLAKACKAHNIQLVVAVRGGVEKEHADTLFKLNRDFRERLTRMMVHIQNRGTPPPKVWWLPPTCLREVLNLAMVYYGIPVFSTLGDYYNEVSTYMTANDFDGILTDDSGFALLKSCRIFSARSLKLTYKGSLETKELFLQKMLSDKDIKPAHWPLLASLLGNHILTPELLAHFYAELTAQDTEEKRTVEETEACTINQLIEFVKRQEDPGDAEAVGKAVCQGNTTNMKELSAKLKLSLEYYQSIGTKKKETTCVERSEIDVQPVKSQKDKQKKPLDSSNGTELKPPAPQEGDAETEKEATKLTDADAVTQDMADLQVNGNHEEDSSTPSKLHIVICPNDAIVNLSIDRHRKGLMSPVIVQALTQREVRLPCYIEQTSALTDSDSKTIIEIYRPIRRSVYAILHNLTKYTYDTKQLAEQNGCSVSPEDIKVNITEHYLGPVGAELKFDVEVTPVQWPVPSIESLWLGVKPENKLRRMKAFFSCMQLGPNPFMTNPNHVPEKFLLICCVLRYLLKCESAELSVPEVDAVLAMTTSDVLFDVQTMQDMQLPLVTPRGVHVASLVMAGIQHAMLVNDTCGAPIHVNNTFPWGYFDGKLLQYKLLKASTTLQFHRLDLCDGQMAQVIMMEKLRQAVFYGLENKLSDKYLGFPFSFANSLSGRMFPNPTAYLRPPHIGRNKGSLMGEFAPVNSRLDGRGGKLQVAGQVVATWGPRPNGKGGQPHKPGEFNVTGEEQSSLPNLGAQASRNNPKKKHGYHHNRHNHYNENKSRSQNTTQNNSHPGKQAVVIATKDEVKGEEVAANEIGHLNGSI